MNMLRGKAEKNCICFDDVIEHAKQVVAENAANANAALSQQQLHGSQGAETGAHVAPPAADVTLARFGHASCLARGRLSRAFKPNPVLIC